MASMLFNVGRDNRRPHAGVPDAIMLCPAVLPNGSSRTLCLGRQQRQQRIGSLVHRAPAEHLPHKNERERMCFPTKVEGNSRRKERSEDYSKYLSALRP